MSEELRQAAIVAMQHAHAPYSEFPVGAAIRTGNGNVHVGCNIENASFPEAICAETAAIAQMISAGDRDIVEIAVIAQKKPLITPCGGCRQRLSEFATQETRIYLCDAEAVRETITLGELLPRAFGSEAL